MLGALFASWYAANIAFNLYNKQVLKVFAYPITVTQVQVRPVMHMHNNSTRTAPPRKGMKPRPCKKPRTAQRAMFLWRHG